MCGVHNMVCVACVAPCVLNCGLVQIYTVGGAYIVVGTLCHNIPNCPLPQSYGNGQVLIHATAVDGY